MKYATLSASLFAFALSANAGWSTNGADYLREQNNPWFLGTDPVHYCLHQDPRDPMPASELSEIVADSFRLWKDFFKKYGFDLTALGDARSQGQFLDGKVRRLSIDFREVPSCEAQRGDLEIFVGAKNTYIERAIDQGVHRGAGLAIRDEYNHENFRNGGYIWVATFPGQRLKLQHMLMHEIGHVLGMKHNSVHVMDEEIANRLTDDRRRPQELGVIESSRWKYQTNAGETLNFFMDLERSGKISTGFASLKDIPADLRQRLGLPNEGRYQASLRFLRYADMIKTHIFSLELKVEGEAPRSQRTFSILSEETKEQRYQDWTPGVYTKWRQASGSDLFYEQLADFTSKPRDLIGVISIGGTKMAATINLEKGVVVRIFEPNEGKWWELR